MTEGCGKTWRGRIGGHVPMEVAIHVCKAAIGVDHICQCWCGHVRAISKRERSVSLPDPWEYE